MNRARMSGDTQRILTITPNPALDQTYRVEHLLAGETHRVAAPHSRAGGKGLNVARVVHQMGHPVLAVAPVGGTTGDEFTAELDASGVPHRLVLIAGSTRRTLAFVSAADGQTSIFNEHGATLASSEWDALDAVFDDELATTAVMTGSGSLPADAADDIYAQWVRRAAAAGVPSVIDTSGPALILAAEAGADVLKPNQQELMEATGAATVTAAAEHLLDLGAKAVFVSGGSRGMRLYSQADRPYVWNAAVPQLRGNPTGAGDAAVAAIAVVLASGSRGPLRMLRAAAAWSAAAVLMPVAGQIHPDCAALEDQVAISGLDVDAELER